MIYPRGSVWSFRACHELDGANMKVVRFRGPTQDFSFDPPKAIKDHMCRWTLQRFVRQTIDAKLDEGGGTTNLTFVNGKAWCRTLECVVVSKFAASNLAENDTERIHIGREVEFVAKEDFWRHV
jgi:hypothetical protein